MNNEQENIIIIGAGPAGLSCAYYLLKYTDFKPIIIEASEFIGGISRTHNYNGNRIDLGGHRFFTKSEEVMRLWQEIFPVQQALSKDELILGLQNNLNVSENLNPEISDNIFLKRRRISRIYFMKKFFDYPVSFKLQTFVNLGLINVLKSGIGFIIAGVHKRRENSLEDFYINRFGKNLYKMFFENYTEKVWGIHPSKISPEWGSQRVKGLSLTTVIKNALFKPFIKKEKIETSLIEEFLYPKKGPGQLYEQMAEIIKNKGGCIILNNTVKKINFQGNNISSIVTEDNNGEKHNYKCKAVFSSMPVKDLINSFNKEIDSKIKDTALNLPYRDFMTAGLLVKKMAVRNTTKYKTVGNIIPDCWIYIQERDVKLGRVQVFNNWSPYMVKDFEHTVWLGLEYFCKENDELWSMNDDDFIRMASNELEKTGLINKNDILDSTVIRVKKAYPAYFGAYKDFNIVKEYLNTIENLYCIGRNGQHRYNNMDHSILTGFEAVKSFINNSSKENIWSVNTENEYHEKK